MSEPLLPDRPAEPAPVRKRPRPGERRLQILQTLAVMLEQNGAERVTTAALAARLGVSEAALYRHFASKAQMWEALIDFAEDNCMALMRQVSERESPGPAQAARMLDVLLQFAEKNPGLCRLITGQALAGESERLQARLRLFLDKLEAQWRQALRGTEGPTPTLDAQVGAAWAVSVWLGRVQRYVHSEFKRLPTEHAAHVLPRMF